MMQWSNRYHMYTVFTMALSLSNCTIISLLHDGEHTYNNMRQRYNTYPTPVPQTLRNEGRRQTVIISAY